MFSQGTRVESITRMEIDGLDVTSVVEQDNENGTDPAKHSKKKGNGTGGNDLFLQRRAYRIQAYNKFNNGMIVRRGSTTCQVLG